MNTKQISSVEDADDPHPWYDVQITDGRPEIASDSDGGTGFDMSATKAQAPDWASAPSPPARATQTDVTYAVTEAGEFSAYTAADVEDVPPLRAHLAWYDADADEFTVVEFTE